MPLVDRALQVLERREVRPQLGLLKSTMLQLDSTFNEKAYGSGSFTDFVEKLQKENFVTVTGGEGRYMIKRKSTVEEKRRRRSRKRRCRFCATCWKRIGMEVDNGVAGGRTGGLGEGRASDFQLAGLRLPGVRRAAELRAG